MGNGGGGATAVEGGGGGRLTRRLAAVAGGGGTGIWAAPVERMNWLAESVPSVPQAGQATGQGMRLFTGSTANS